MLVAGTSFSSRIIAGLCRALLTWALLFAGFGWSGACFAASPEESLEYTVKAAYLTKFGAFVEWPPGLLGAPDSPFVIGVLGNDPFGPALERIASAQTIQGRPIRIKRLSRTEQFSGVHLLYISATERHRLPSLAAELSAQNILTVGDAGMPGVIINFVIDNNRVRFEIDLVQAEKAELKISSRLLSVAKTVKADSG